MPNLGPFELIIILVIVIIIFGAGKLPQLGGALGQSIREFRSATKAEEEEERARKAKAEEAADDDEEA